MYIHKYFVNWLSTWYIPHKPNYLSDLCSPTLWTWAPSVAAPGVPLVTDHHLVLDTTKLGTASRPVPNGKRSPSREADLLVMTNITNYGKWPFSMGKWTINGPWEKLTEAFHGKIMYQFYHWQRLVGMKISMYMGFLIGYRYVWVPEGKELLTLAYQCIVRSCISPVCFNSHLPSLIMLLIIHNAYHVVRPG